MKTGAEYLASLITPKNISTTNHWLILSLTLREHGHKRVIVLVLHKIKIQIDYIVSDVVQKTRLWANEHYLKSQPHRLLNCRR